MQLARVMAEERPVRVAQFTKAFWLGGTETQVLELIRSLPASYELQLAVLEAEGALIDEVRALGHDPTEFPLAGSAAHPGTARQVLNLSRWLESRGIELLHVHDFYSALIGVPAAKLAGVKVVVSRFDLAHWHSRVQRGLLRTMTRLADHTVANAHAIREMLVHEEHIPSAKVSVIPNGIDLRRFDQKAKEPLWQELPDPPGPVALLVANMSSPVKRQDDFIVALALARREVPTLTGWLVGDGLRRPELEGLARAHGIADAVVFLGYRGDVPAIWQRTTMGVNCSAAEGLSNAVIEGMAASRPMVVTHAGGNPELIADGARGFVVAPGRPVALARAMVRLSKDVELRRRMGAAGRAYVERHLTSERLARDHDRLYRRLLEKRGEGR